MESTATDENVSPTNDSYPTLPNPVTTRVTALLSTTNTTSLMTSASHHSSDSDENIAGKVLAVVISLVAIAVLAVLGYCYLKRSGKLARLSCHKYRRARRSSTSSSRRALEDNDVIDPPSFPPRPKPTGDTDDMFTIEEFEDAHEEVGNKEEYFYDEVFGQSQFEDEATNSAMRELYSTRDSGGDEEMLDLDFETLGIKIDKMDSLRKSSK